MGKAAEKLVQLSFEMPDDQEWDPGFWAKLGVGGDWENLGRAFYRALCQVDESEDIVLEFPRKNLDLVRKIVRDAKNGLYGPDVKTYWSKAREVPAD